MNVDLSQYKNLNICAAVSGGRDSMALLHILCTRGNDYGICVSAVNFDHKMRGESSARDSGFVKEYCKKLGVPLLFYSWDETGEKTETSARKWRLSKYADAVLPHTLPDGGKWRGADVIATAHHLDDNAETVLFNLARGSGISGLTGIRDEAFPRDRKPFKIIRPLIACSRAEIDEYIAENGIPYVDDETNFSDGYTRNKLRLNVLPELEKAVPGASRALFRISRIAAEEEEYFDGIINARGLVKYTPFGYEIADCAEKPLFKRAVLKVMAAENKIDYTSAQFERLYALQTAERGKKFEFLGLTAIKEEGRISVFGGVSADGEEPFGNFCGQKSAFCGVALYFCDGGKDCLPDGKILRFDRAKIPAGAVVRFMRAGDRFKKFGGGTKNLGDYFTDKKIPARLRARVPLVAAGNEILIVCGVEISELVKAEDIEKAWVCVAPDFSKLSK